MVIWINNIWVSTSDSNSIPFKNVFQFLLEQFPHKVILIIILIPRIQLLLNSFDTDQF